MNEFKKILSWFSENYFKIIFALIIFVSFYFIINFLFPVFQFFVFIIETISKIGDSFNELKDLFEKENLDFKKFLEKNEEALNN